MNSEFNSEPDRGLTNVVDKHEPETPLTTQEELLIELPLLADYISKLCVLLWGFTPDSNVFLQQQQQQNSEKTGDTLEREFEVSSSDTHRTSRHEDVGGGSQPNHSSSHDALLFGDKLIKFASDPQMRSLMIEKIVKSEDDVNIESGMEGGNIVVKREESQKCVGENGRQSVEFRMFLNNVFFGWNQSGILILMKHCEIISNSKSIGCQVRLISFPSDISSSISCNEDCNDPCDVNENFEEGGGGSKDNSVISSTPYQTIHSFIAHSLSPYFKSYVREQAKNCTQQGNDLLNTATNNIVGENSGDKMALNMEKKMAELEMGLLHLQQNIDIPQITLPIHPLITKAVDHAQECGVRKPQVCDVQPPEIVQDSNFLNVLQNLVNRWVREIQKVTRLDRDPSSGSAMQEITFWMSMDRSLHRIDEKCISPHVQLTLEILKHGKRFHATVSFEEDTALKQSLVKVNDYATLMKDFPINDMLSATNLPRIKSSICTIFTHFRKIRNSRYPVARALRLIEAISRDLTYQLLKVLSTHKLMIVEFDEFEKTLNVCGDIFTIWDDEYEKMQALLRDIVKRKRITHDDANQHLKMVWRVQFQHKRLQMRLEQIRSFRTQHEQLRSVIAKVLSSSSSQCSTTSFPRLASVGHPNGIHPLENGIDKHSSDVTLLEVNNAYNQVVNNVDVLDISIPTGCESFVTHIKRYESRIDRVETRITSRLRDQLATARNANEMFRIFSKYNALFVRPHIRGAIREYQTQLIARVKDDIEALQEKFKVEYGSCKAARLAASRDLPPIAGSIIWARQIDRQLTTYLTRVEHVLGRGWENHVDGQKLKADGEAFRVKLSTQQIFEDWVRQVSQSRNLTVTGRIFSIDTTPNKGGGSSHQTSNTYKLKVNFLPEIIQLTKEVRNLKNLGFRVPMNIVNKAHQANQLYPFAISLIESVSSYERCTDKLESHGGISVHSLVHSLGVDVLVAGIKKEVQLLLSEGMNLFWESYKLDNYVSRLSESIWNFQERVDFVISVSESLELHIRELETCRYSQSAFTSVISKIQKIVDDLSLQQYSNLEYWVYKLDLEVEKRLAARLEEGVNAWADTLIKQSQSVLVSSSAADLLFRSTNALHFEDDLITDDGKLRGGSSKSTGATTKQKNACGGEPNIKRILLELRLTNQTMFLFPSLHDARHCLLHQLFAWQAIVTSQHRIEAARYKVGLDKPSICCYSNILLNVDSTSLNVQSRSAVSLTTNTHPSTTISGGISSNSAVYCLHKAYQAIEKELNEVKIYVEEWLRYQSLWDLQFDVLTSRFGGEEALSNWINLLSDIKKCRSTFDTSERRKHFGVVVIDYGRVQSKVSLKYDSWHKEALSAFANIFSTKLSDFYSQLTKCRTALESQNRSIENATTSEAVNVITDIQCYRRKLKVEWNTTYMNKYDEAQRILERHRFHFPHNWLYVDNVEGEWSAFNELVKRKSKAIESQVSTLQVKILAEDKQIEIRSEDFIVEWERGKPVAGHIPPLQASQTIAQFETKISRLKDERENINRAKEALELNSASQRGGGGSTSSGGGVGDKLIVAFEELQDLKNVWEELSDVWDEIYKLREESWIAVNPRKLRQSIEILLNKLKNEFSSSLKQYAGYEFLKKTLNSYGKVNKLIVELKCDGVKERHWKDIFHIIDLPSSLLSSISNTNDLTLGQMWDAIDFNRHEKHIRDVLIVAQGEMALEEFLKQVRDTWQHYLIDLVSYQNNKCKLIRGWDDLFSKLKENLNQLSAMKVCEYYRVFEDECLSWLEKLNRLNGIFDIWIDVQRKWVYLEGIFSSNVDIANLLPVETSRFNAISGEFLGLMRKVSKLQLAIDVLNIQGIQRCLERLSDLLAKVQKALGEYLERERSDFARFYFVGDEDLLEIIGNSKNIDRLQKHFKKMFAGISSLIISQDGEEITGFCSREGEMVTIVPHPIKLSDYPRINDWLTQVEVSMKRTLATLLSHAIQERWQHSSSDIIVNEGNGGCVLSPIFMGWVDKYPAQLTVLALQVIWTSQIEKALSLSSSSSNLQDIETDLKQILNFIDTFLDVLSEQVLKESSNLIRRRKLEHLIYEYVHRRTVTRYMIRYVISIKNNTKNSDKDEDENCCPSLLKSFEWIKQMRFYFKSNEINVVQSNSSSDELFKQLRICIADATFHYGFEYLGVQDRLVITPLTDKFYLSMTQALSSCLGGSPFGPAGTGKTETVKALGHQLGRFVLVFNCDDTFDFQAMGRIFVGLCQVGAWGCFDEFNRLEERMLSAVSQQIQTIQECLRTFSSLNNTSSSYIEHETTTGNPSKKNQIELIGRKVCVNSNMAIFITMNPGYAGRSNLPDNLKKLFCNFAVTKPDVTLIAEVMLFSQGFANAESLSRKVVPLFKLCVEQLSAQSHYDFGLRALKSVLVSAGHIKRVKHSKVTELKAESVNKLSDGLEQKIVVQSICQTIEPKLVSDDIPLLLSLINDVFPNVEHEKDDTLHLRSAISQVCKEFNYICADKTCKESSSSTQELPVGGKLNISSAYDINGDLWTDKVLQLNQIVNLHHGLMMVGPSGSGKTSSWKVLLKALTKLDGIEGMSYVINPKSMSKESLYGSLDATTREWKDGFFTHILRKIIDNVRGEMGMRHWFIFDGDVDPDWVENLNSVLDDNKLLTLPNGERLPLPSNVRIMFEVQDLRYATPATVSRCGMVWYSHTTLSDQMIIANYLIGLQHSSLINENTFIPSSPSIISSVSSSFQKSTLGTSYMSSVTSNGSSSMLLTTSSSNSAPILEEDISPTLMVQREIVSLLCNEMLPVNSFVIQCLNFAESSGNSLTPHSSPSKVDSQSSAIQHIMHFSRLRALNSLFAMMTTNMRKFILNYEQQIEFNSPTMNSSNGIPFGGLSEISSKLHAFTLKSLISCVLWSFVGDSTLKCRDKMSQFVQSITTSVDCPSNANIMDFEVTIEGNWRPWSSKVPRIELESHKVGCPDVVVPTVDTIRHENLLHTLLSEHKPMVLCGPPGSGKTMTLFCALRNLPDLEVVGLNFSSATTPQLIMKTLEHYCHYSSTSSSNKLVMAPTQLNKWLVMFCDEINLPDADSYGTQRVISFLRQLVELNGFYKSTGGHDHVWVTLERIQFVGACNPPTDPGRKPLDLRFLRHVSVFYVDYPGRESLIQIYSTFNRAMLKVVRSVRSFVDPLTHAMVEVFERSRTRFTQEMQPHYVYSPREMTRWVRGIKEAICPLDDELVSIEYLVRIWAHEGLRLFHDRLIHNCERAWTWALIEEVASQHFPSISKFDIQNEVLKGPILYSNWLSKHYIPVERQQLKEYVKARLKIFYEEELDVPLVLFDEVLDHILRIDRIFRQPQGHLLMIGVSGSGRTTLSRFVAWLNGLSVFQIKVHNRYCGDDFDDDLRHVLRRAGCRCEKICFILDESSVLESSFLERMNTLLANGEVPGLFEGDEYTSLMSACKEASQRDGLLFDSNDELYKWFTTQVMNNLHVIFTMNPPQSTVGKFESSSLKEKAATSPALFNRCVLNWYGDWSNSALYQVSKEFTNKTDLDKSSWRAVPKHEFSKSLPFCVIPQTEIESLDKEMISHREAVLNTMVYVHHTIQRVSEKLARHEGTTSVMHVTPRHFLDFIAHFVSLYAEKLSSFQDQQLHLNIGLTKIRETVVQVEEMQKSLAVKSNTLISKNEMANAKLKQMVKDQQEAEMQKTQSETLQNAIEKQKISIASKREEVLKDLARVEPAVKESQLAVKSIKKQHLVEVRSMSNPPPAIKLALESICLLLGEMKGGKEIDWKGIRSVIIKENFIPTIVNFNTEGLSESTLEQMKIRYIDMPEYTYEKAQRASNACGPLVKWAIAQYNFADMLKKVDPLRRELQQLEDRANEKQTEADNIVKTITLLENSINEYKTEYAQLISQAEAIKNDLKQVQEKVDRSMSLLKSLTVEKERWAESCDGFQTQISTLIGDVLLASAYLSYVGFYDQQIRVGLLSKWKLFLDQSGIEFSSQTFDVTQFTSDFDERNRWRIQSGLADNDDLCLENAVMLNKFKRYPLIIDPSGQAVSFIMREYASRKITKTSFLDESFRKNLESALRFGNPILVEDAENYDSILNTVLNREVRRTAGRVLISLADQDIDLSPSFTIFLSTRDPSVQFKADLCSRVTFINFTITKSSLKLQCMNNVLKAERPDVNEKRSNLVKIQGEFQLRLRHLEKELLNVLNEVEGKILDDDTVISTLEKLKLEADEVSAKADQTKDVMRDVDDALQMYQPIGEACSSIFFVIDSLSQINKLYQFSLKSFLKIFHDVLLDQKRVGVSSTLRLPAPIDDLTVYKTRSNELTRNLFVKCYDTVCRGLLEKDKTVFALALTKIYFEQTIGCCEGLSKSCQDIAMKTFMKSVAVRVDSHKEDSCDTQRLDYIHDVLKSEEYTPHIFPVEWIEKLFQELNSDGSTNVMKAQYENWIVHSNPEDCVPYFMECDDKSTDFEFVKSQMLAIRKLIIITLFRNDRFIPASHRMMCTLVSPYFGPGASYNLQAASDEESSSASANALSNVVITELRDCPQTPVLLCSMPGQDDASDHVVDLAHTLHKNLISIAIGSEEGFVEADKAINGAIKTGKWVLLKNVHLAFMWLSSLEKRLHVMSSSVVSNTTHANFRLFMTSEITPKLPVNLLRACSILTFEPAAGIQANLIRTYTNSFSGKRVNKPPQERSRLYFLLAWLHAVLQERMTYVPLGWSKSYEFGESELRRASEIIDKWVDYAAKDRTNLPPSKIPWLAIQTILTEVIYGGKVDSEFDRILLNSFIQRLFRPASFGSCFSLLSSHQDAKDDNGESSILIPDDAITREDFASFISNSSWKSKENPQWLGLPSNSRALLLSQMGRETRLCLKSIQQFDDDFYLEDVDDIGSEKVEQMEVFTAGWLKIIGDNLPKWLDLLPKCLSTPGGLKSNSEYHPLVLFMLREVKYGSKLLSRVREDLSRLFCCLNSNNKQSQSSSNDDNCIRLTASERELGLCLARQCIPPSWKALVKFPYFASNNIVTVDMWISDLNRRIRHLQEIMTATSDGKRTLDHKLLQDYPFWLGGFFNPESFLTASRQCVAQSSQLSLEDLQLEIHFSLDEKIKNISSSLVNLKLQGAVTTDETEQHSISITDEANWFSLPTLYLTWVKRSHDVSLDGNTDSDLIKLPVYLNTSRKHLLFSAKLKLSSGQNINHFVERSVAIIADVTF